MSAGDSNDDQTAAQKHFASTHWSVVLAAARSDSPEAAAALEKLCATYWYPLYFFLRHKRGLAHHAAQDLVQEFFASRVVTKRIFKGLQPDRGRFWSWLLTSLQNLAENEREKAQAARRGGGQPHVPLDFNTAEGRYAAEPAHQLTPEKLFERQCAFELFALVLNQLREKYRRAGKADWFEELKVFLPGEHSDRSHAEAAARLGQREDAIKMAVSRLRREYGQLLRAEVGRLVDDPSRVTDELRAVRNALQD